MPNVIKSATTVSIGSLDKYNFLVGVDSSVGYSPTSITDFWNGIVPPSGGYTVYAQKSSEGPSIRVAANDNELITIAKQYGGTNINTVYDALNYFNGQSIYMVTNIDYPNIVTSGLTLLMDAGFIPSYPRTGTTWSDLSGNNYVGTLNNGPTFSGANEGSIGFNGSNTYVSTTYTQPAQSSSTSFSWNLWVYPVRNSNLDIFMGNRNTTLNFIKLTSNNFEYYPMAFGGTMTLNTWQNISVVKNGSSFAYYKNGSQTLTSGSTASLVANPFFIGGDNTAAEYAQGRVAIASIYNRALSATEVSQNYNALRSRFGL
jgi:hypothetical protein